MNKLIYLIALITIFATQKSEAQVPPNQSDCFIKYHYDAAGNRIKREFVCETNLPNYKTTGTETVKSTSNENISVYPNPTFEYLYIDLPLEAKDGKVSLNDIQGKQIALFNIKRNLRISTLNLIPGIYTITISVGKDKYVRKITKL
jgi:hypothetical protein